MRCLILCLATVLAAGSSAVADEPGRPDAPERTVLWANPLDAPADLAAGAGQLEPAHGRPAALRIDKPSPEDSALHLIELPAERLHSAWIYVSADIRADQVSAKPEDWNGIKLMLKVESPAGTRWPQAPIPTGTFGWQRFSARVFIPADATAITLFLGLEKVSGTVWFDDLRITLARRIAQPPPAPADQPIFRGHDLPRLRGAMAHPRMKREDLAHFAADWGGNLIRWQLLYMPPPAEAADLDRYDRWLSEELDRLDDVLAWAAELGVYIVVDLHSPPGGPVGGGGTVVSAGDFWTRREAQARFISAWERIARRYRGNSTIWGFDLLNEPDDRGVTEACDDWQTLADRAGRAIRAIDPDRTLIVEAPHWANAEGLIGFTPLDLPRIVYSIHMYTPMAFTHQALHAPGPAVAYPGPAEDRHWDKAALETALQPAIDFAARHRVHIYVGEFSAIRWAPGAERYLADLTALFEAHGWDWTYHAYREWHGWNLELSADRDDLTPTPNPRLEAILHWMRQNHPKPQPVPAE